MKVGEYVRTKYGEICKLKKSRFKDLVYETDIEIDRCNDRDCNDYGFDSNTIQDIIKSSPNIIDLIEENDIIKFWYEKERICHVYKVNNKLCVWDGFQDRPIEGITIISIVTKEQFENMEYKVKE